MFGASEHVDGEHRLWKVLVLISQEVLRTDNKTIRIASQWYCLECKHETKRQAIVLNRSIDQTPITFNFIFNRSNDDEWMQFLEGFSSESLSFSPDLHTSLNYVMYCPLEITETIVKFLDGNR